MSEETRGIVTLAFGHAMILSNLLPKITVKGGSKNVHKSRVQRWLLDQLTEFEKARQELLDEHVKKDENGNKINVEGSYILLDSAAYAAAFAKLQEELPIVIDASSDTVKKNAMEVVRDILVKDESITLTTDESLSYSAIVDKFEAAFPYPEKN